MGGGGAPPSRWSGRRAERDQEVSVGSRLCWLLLAVAGGRGRASVHQARQDAAGCVLKARRQDRSQGGGNRRERGEGGGQVGADGGQCGQGRDGRLALRPAIVRGWWHDGDLGRSGGGHRGRGSQRHEIARGRWRRRGDGQQSGGRSARCQRGAGRSGQYGVALQGLAQAVQDPCAGIRSAPTRPRRYGGSINRRRGRCARRAAARQRPPGGLRALPAGTSCPHPARQTSPAHQGGTNHPRGTAAPLDLRRR